MRLVSSLTGPPLERYLRAGEKLGVGRSWENCKVHRIDDAGGCSPYSLSRRPGRPSEI